MQKSEIAILILIGAFVVIFTAWLGIASSRSDANLSVDPAIASYVRAMADRPDTVVFLKASAKQATDVGFTQEVIIRAVQHGTLTDEDVVFYVEQGKVTDAVNQWSEDREGALKGIRFNSG